jgi:hypothetical protein
MKAILFEIFHETGKTQIIIDAKHRPRIEANSEKGCVIVCRNNNVVTKKILARFGLKHSVVQIGEVDTTDPTYKELKLIKY